MKRVMLFVGAVVGIFLWTLAIAPAADMPLKNMPTVAPIPYTWTGFYVGGNAGYGWQNTQPELQASGSSIITNAIAGLIPANMSNEPRGGVAGGQMGYNWQTGAIVLGIEADLDWSGIGRTANQGVSTPIVGLTAASMTHQQLNDLGTVRARLGFVPWSHMFVYGTGGLAVGQVDTTNAASIAAGAVSIGGTSSLSQTRIGWTAGIGTEFLMSQNWTIKTEVLYVDLGSVTGSFSTNALGPIAPLSVSFSDPYKAWIARAGVNYKF